MRIYKAKQLYGPDGITGLGKTRFYALLKAKDFPAPNVILSERFRGWTDDIVFSWIESKRNDLNQ